jgi:predicted ATP-grasp superfamily ATP-dependent carboligase
MNRIGLVGSGYEWTALPIVREMGRSSIRSFFFSQHGRNPVIHSRYLSGRFQIADLTDTNHITALNNFCGRFGIGSLICLDENLKYSLIEHQKCLPDLKFAFPSLDSYDIAIRKNRSASFVGGLGIPIPETTPIETLSDLEVFDRPFDRDIVVKGIRGVASNHIRYASNYRDLVTSYREIYEIEKDDELADTKPIVQEYIGGPTYLTQGLSQHGKVKIVVPHRKIREWPISGGITTRATTITEPRLVEYTTRVMEALNWHGECGMEWKYDEERDDFYFIEMNPRFEGSVDIAIKAGVNLPKLLLDVIHEKTVPDDLEYRPDTHYRFFFKQDFKYFLTKPYGISGLIRDSIDPRVHGELAIDDMGILRIFWKKPIQDIFNHLRCKGNNHPSATTL